MRAGRARRWRARRVALPPARRGGNLGGVIGHFVDGVAHDFGQRLDIGRKLAARAVNRAVGREQILLRVGAVAEANVNFHRAVAHDRAHADEIGQGEKLAFERPGDERFQFRRGRAGLMRDDADLGEIKPWQHFNGNFQEGINTAGDERAENERPKQGTQQQTPDAWFAVHGINPAADSVGKCPVKFQIGVFCHDFRARFKSALDERLPAARRSRHHYLRVVAGRRMHQHPPLPLVENERARRNGHQ